MKNFDWEILFFPVVILGSLFLIIILAFVTDDYGKYLDAYNTQQDRQLFTKTYEIVIECRKNSSVINMDKICGEVPVFFSQVK
jgi:cellobiose-specific phosphotransferase system component IIC